ncbi:hypothetical protein JCM6882_000779 [Rhodosporidiobolus microsporus]
MADDKEDRCWICGTATRNACGACREAGIVISFCSRAHQKMAWPIHKLVCGPGKAHPFLWPPLSQDKAKVLDQHRADSFVLSASTGPVTSSINQLVKEWQNDLGPNTGELDQLSTSTMEGPGTSTEHQHAVSCFRAAEFLRRASATHSLSTPSPQYDSPPWRSEVHHRCILFFFLKDLVLGKKAQGVHEARATFQAAGHAFRQLIRIVEEDFAEEHPTEAASLRSVLSEFDLLLL